MYVVILIGVLLTRRGLVGAGYWALVAAAGFALVVVLHFGPLAKEHLSDLAGQYGGSRIKGAVAGWWLLLLLVSLAATTAYCTRRWAMLRQAVPAPSPAR